jgi:hypothetical protein
MPLQATQTVADAPPLAGPQAADLAVSDVVRRWDARQALLRRQPLVALALHAIAIHEHRCDNTVCAGSLIATLAHEAKAALRRENVDPSLIDELYGRARCVA